MSVDNLAARLRAALAQLDQGRQTITAAAGLIGDAGQTLATAVRGSGDVNAVEAAVQLARVHEDLTDPADAASRAAEIVLSYLINIGASGTGSVSVSSPSRSQPPAGPLGVENRHGYRYPDAALPYSDDLPPRVLRGRRNAPMTGRVEVGGRDYGTIGADHGDIWSDEVRTRMKVLQLPARAIMLAHHVEMKVVAMMVKSGARNASGVSQI